MRAIFANNATTQLAVAINNTATSIVVASGAAFPTPVAGVSFFYATLDDGMGGLEIVKVTARSGGAFTVERGQEGTIARSFATGSIVSNRPTAAGLNQYSAKSFGSVLVSGQPTVEASTDSPLTLVAGQNVAITTNAATDTVTISAASQEPSFKTIAVAGQTNIDADTISDTLTVAAGSNITLTTNAATDTLTIAAVVPAAPTAAFTTVAVAGQSDVVADSLADTLTLVAGSNISLTTNATTDAVTIAANVPAAPATAFTKIAVSGQTTVESDTTADTLTLVAGTNISITTDAANDSITINASTGGAIPNAFGTITVAGQSDVVADTTSDTLTLVAGSNVTLTTNAAADSITIAAATGNPTVTTTAANTSYPFVLATTQTTGAQALLMDSSGGTYNPSTNTADINISGNAATATTATTAGSATSATNAANISITADSASASRYVTFVDTTSGNNAAKVDTDLIYNPSTNVMTTNISGNATSANTAGSAASATNATNAANTSITADSTTNAARYVTFVDTTSGNNAQKVDTDLTYNPSTNTMATNISGNAATATTAGSATSATSATSASTVALTQTRDSNRYPLVFGTTYTAGGNQVLRNRLPVFSPDDDSGTYQPDINTAKINISGSANSATSATNVNVTATAAAASYPLVFAPLQVSGAQGLLIDSSGGTYNPSTNTADINISGNAATASTATNATTAFTALNTDITSDAANATRYITFVPDVVGNNPHRVDLDLTYNPSTNVMTTNISGNAATATTANSATTATTATTATSVTYHQSAQYAITSGGAVSYAHGLGVTPSTVESYLVCQTAEAGYTVGQRLFFGSLYYDDGTAVRGASVIPSATLITVRFSSATNVYVAPNATTGGRVALTNANWRVVFLTWA